jgi:glycine/D-amino acid oxidase-like deaminating enzyme
MLCGIVLNMIRVVIVGGGIVGAACAFYVTTQPGVDVTVIERHAVSAGTTGAGEGNVLVSDKEAGPELSIALRSSQLWTELGDGLGADSFEMERKGGVVVAETADALEALRAFSAKQRHHGVHSKLLNGEQLAELEPHVAPGLAGGAYYPFDIQVQPMLAAACLLRAAVHAGAHLHLGAEATGLVLHHGRIGGIETDEGVFPADYVVNAAGPWAGQLSERFGAPIPVVPRRGFILVTEPLPKLIRHKVYTADYVANVASRSEGLETSLVIEGTRSGTVLIGASRERVGFDRTISLHVVSQLAVRAVELFPVLGTVNVMRVYAGFRPYCPDHLPAIGHDPRIPGLLHACGHEGSGIGMAPATGELISQLIAGQATSLDSAPFSPDRLIGQSV